MEDKYIEAGKIALEYGPNILNTIVINETANVETPTVNKVIAVRNISISS